jgi:glucuronate isomerase
MDVVYFGATKYTTDGETYTICTYLYQVQAVELDSSFEIDKKLIDQKTAKAFYTQKTRMFLDDKLPYNFVQFE